MCVGGFCVPIEGAAAIATEQKKASRIAVLY